MKKQLLALMGALIVSSMFVARADEGMWLPSLIEQGRIKDMKQKGFRLSAKEIYAINESSIKDAVVQFGRGCTGEMISNEGLLLTNHHCGYPQIQAHSTLKNDYLTHGFVAANRQQELPNKGLTVSFLQYMKDVTTEATEGVKADMTATERETMIAANCKQIAEAATDGGRYRASVESMYYGNQYFLFVYEEFRDIRLVFAPASSIGKFGGDTDNWMWPRHTGDFSMFRVYADKNNCPADYSKDNVPYRPRRSLVISRKGVREGDFTMVYGYPGRTSEYLHSRAVHYILSQTNPMRIALRTAKLDFMNEAAAKDPELRIKYAAKNANVANAWKKWQGESKGLKRLGTIDKKRALEARFTIWAADKPEYIGVVDQLSQMYDSIQPWNMAQEYYGEALFAVEALNFVQSFQQLNKETYNAERLKAYVQTFFKDYDVVLDRRIAAKLLAEFAENVPSQFVPEGVDMDQLMQLLRRDELFLYQDKMLALLEQESEQAITAIHNSPLYVMVQKLSDKRNNKIRPQLNRMNARITELYRPYMKGLMEMQAGERPFYPDANFTLRVAYGKVRGYEPFDAVYYRPMSTLRGVSQKDNPEIYDYNVPEKLREIIRTNDYGPHKVDGTVPLAFIATNHTTGGNSGSPVLNAHGQLIGLNFDRTWEGTMSDIEFDESLCRNIALDIRYVLFVVDKVGGAGYLFNEMKFDKPFHRK